MVQPELALKWRICEWLNTREFTTVPGWPRATTYLLSTVAHVVAILFEEQAP
jgi:hypothetical protein